MVWLRRPDLNKSPTEWRDRDLWRQRALIWQASQDMGGAWNKTRMLSIHCRHIQFWELRNGGGPLEPLDFFFFFIIKKVTLPNPFTCIASLSGDSV